ncbi:MAG: rod-binding protein [Candidatus Muiribacteriota bacterium]
MSLGINEVSTLSSISRQNSIENKSMPKNVEKLKETCNEFEAIFAQQMLKAMRETVNKTGFVDGGNAEEIFQSMLDEEYANKMSKEGDLGLSEMLFEQLKPGL